MNQWVFLLYIIFMDDSSSIVIKKDSWAECQSHAVIAQMETENVLTGCLRRRK